MDKAKYMAAYNKQYKEMKAKRSAGKPPKPYNTIEDKYLIDRHKHTSLVVYPTGVNFKGSDLDNPIVCSHFGCATHLSNEEKRFGTTRIHHQKKKKLDITLFVSQSKIA